LDSALLALSKFDMSSVSIHLLFESDNASRALALASEGKAFIRRIHETVFLVLPSVESLSQILGFSPKDEECCFLLSVNVRKFNFFGSWNQCIPAMSVILRSATPALEEILSDRFDVEIIDETSASRCTHVLMHSSECQFAFRMRSFHDLIFSSAKFCVYDKEDEVKSNLLGLREVFTSGSHICR
jgi:hypothetical protein